MVTSKVDEDGQRDVEGVDEQEADQQSIEDCVKLASAGPINDDGSQVSDDSKKPENGLADSFQPKRASVQKIFLFIRDNFVGALTLGSSSVEDGPVGGKVVRHSVLRHLV
jgi:hypothetical protein